MTTHPPKTPPTDAPVTVNCRANDGGLVVMARAVAMPPEAAEGELVFMPAGENRITATVDGKAEAIMVNVDSSTAIRLQADLTARLAGTVQPFLDYNHEGGRASGRPTAFRWDAQRGVVCDVAWTAAARSSIRDGEWSYFSPEFRYDRKNKAVLGLRNSGAVGALVNDPAFRNIGAVRAAHKESDDSETPNSQPPNPTQPAMDKIIVAALVAAGLISNTEAGGDGAAALVSARIADLKNGGEASVKAAHATALGEKDARIAALEADVTAAKTDAAKSAVDAAVKAGRIPAKDEASQKFWIGSIVAQGEVAVSALNAQPGNKALTPTQASSTEGSPEASAADDEVQAAAVSARAVAIANERKIPFSTAWADAQAEVQAAHA